MCCDDGSDAWLVEQRWCERLYVCEQLAFELVGFSGRCLDSVGEAAQDESGGDLVGCPRRAAETAAAVEQPSGWEATQLLAEPLGRSDDHRAQLGERFAPDVDGATTGDQQQSQRFASLASRAASAASRRSRPLSSVADAA